MREKARDTVLGTDVAAALHTAQARVGCFMHLGRLTAAPDSPYLGMPKLLRNA